MTQLLKRVFELINKTGDRCIVLSPESGEAYAVMSLKEYERIALGKSEVTSLTEDELLDKINRDIAIWKSQQEEPEFGHNADEIDDVGFGEYKDVVASYPNSPVFSTDEQKITEEEDLEEDPYYFESV